MPCRTGALSRNVDHERWYRVSARADDLGIEQHSHARLGARSAVRVDLRKQLAAPNGITRLLGVDLLAERCALEHGALLALSIGSFYRRHDR